MTRGCSDQEVNTEFDKDLTTHKLQDQIFTDRKYIPSRFQIQHNLPICPGGN